MTRRPPSKSSGITYRHAYQLCDHPGSRSTDGPLPPSTKCRRTPLIIAVPRRNWRQNVAGSNGGARISSGSLDDFVVHNELLISITNRCATALLAETGPLRRRHSPECFQVATCASAASLMLFEKHWRRAARSKMTRCGHECLRIGAAQLTAEPIPPGANFCCNCPSRREDRHCVSRNFHSRLVCVGTFFGVGLLAPPNRVRASDASSPRRR
jgi:hypothetical protein